MTAKDPKTIAADLLICPSVWFSEILRKERKAVVNTTSVLFTR